MSTNFSPTPAELNIVTQIFAQADPQKLGVLTGEVAVKVFGGAKLPPTTLGEIWNISDEDNKGWLPKKGVAIAVRLIGWAQKGEKITQALTNKPGPLAVIEGINTVAQHNTGISLSKSPPPSFPPLTPQDKAKFQNMFLKQGPFNGLLSGDKARDIFVKSKLSNEQLLKIWNLADTQDRGALDSTDFAIGMYFIQGVMTGKISFIPTSLPPGLYQQAGGASTTTSVMSNMTGNSGSFSPVGSIFPPQHTGQSQMMLQQDYTGLSSQPFRAPTLPARPSAHANGHAVDWDVTAAEKVLSDGYFDTLDTQKKGFIEGDVAVPFMLKSNLPGEILAQVWDLADINNDGCLTKDGFAVAMHLIQKKLAGQEVPATLPQSLIPPSARAAVNTGSPFSPPHTQTQHQQPEPAIDLFSFDDTPPSSAAPHMQPMHTGPMQPQITGPAFSPTQARRVASDPFSSAGPFHSSPHQDLLSDDDVHPAAAASPPLQDRSAEIGNAKNQLQSTNRSLDTAKQEREVLEQTLANQASQLSTLQTQLSSAKAAYETEVNILAALKERRSSQIADIDKTRHELITAESNLSALRAEKAEIEGAFLRDKEEARDLHKRMVEAGQQAEALKTDVEKLKKEAKQQKGLLAIARKQLSTKEAERAKAEKEHEEAVAEVTSIGEEKDTIEAEIERLGSAPIPTAPIPKVASPSPSASLMLAAAQPLPTTPEISSPSAAKSNNPFERLAMTSSPPPQSTSPFLGLSNTIISSPPISVAEVASPPQSFQTPADTTPSEAPKPDSSAFDDFTSGLDHHDGTELSYLDEANDSRAHDIPPSPTTGNSATEFFMTPPTSAHNETSPGINAADRFPSMLDISANLATEQVPTLSLENAATAPAPAPAQKETDLNTKLHDLEIEESDSDDDTDSDDEPLAKTLDKGKGRAIDPIPLGEKEAPPAIALPAAAAVPSAFDDVFGSPNPAHTGNGNANGNGHATSTPFDLSSTVADKSQDLFGSKPLEGTPTVAGVNEFDETLGKVTASAVATPVNFSFESSFDDTFDFGSNTQPVQSAVPQATAPEVAPKNDFAGIFGTASPTSFTPAPVPTVTTQPTNITMPNVPKFESSFDSAFADFDSAPALNLDNNMPKPSSPTVVKEAKSVTGSFPSSPVHSPSQSAMQARISEIRAVSPTPRARSPPPRTNSPKPRLSTSSNKEPFEKPKEVPTRSSKLSIRLPFGRKKKHTEPMPPPPVQHLSPPMEQISRVGTPSSEDDVESVKQLTDMGFSRSQAVDALEKYGYDVQKALNSLLGSQ